MSKRKKKQSTKQPTKMQEIKEEVQQSKVQSLEPINAPQGALNERLNHAYIAKEYTLLNGGSDNVIMIQAGREGRYPIDVLLTFDGLEEVMEQLRPETKKIEPSELPVTDELV